ncbi:tissue factor-like isoform X2 [Thalassophryne amazonica]|uniref:tissue factor-like isoform X2 n=1 Tax=Thalassophryne amazonica TaxID=390379 RepID=UPI001470B009|nr:tissue factor-like isoform X2 [Thalassophryne amazonica]
MSDPKTLLGLRVCLWAWIYTATADDVDVVRAETVRWVSLDFKTLVVWNSHPSNYSFTVMYSEDHQDWNTSPDCIKIYESQCDLTNYLTHLDRSYTADIQTEMDYDTDENFPHTLSPVFNPYRESEISAVSFTVDTVEDDKVMLHITDPLSGIHRNRKHLTIRDILKTDLKYKISYYKAGSTGKRDIISDSNVAEVSNLDAGQSYCFMVAAYIPSRPKANQLGAWSKQQCTAGHTSILQDLSIGALIGVLFILLVVIIVFIIVTVLCCKCCRKRSDQRSSAV